MNTNPLDLYAILGLTRDASAEEIRAAYRRMAQKHHPDKGGNPAAFNAIQGAYDILGDEDRRAAYDRCGTTDTGPDLRAMAMENVAATLTNLIDHPGIDVTTVDLTKELRANVIGHRTRLTAGRNEITKRIQKREKAGARITSKSGSSSPALAMIVHGIRQLQNELQVLDRNLQVLDHMDSIIDDIEYRVDEAPQHGEFTVIGWFHPGHAT